MNANTPLAGRVTANNDHTDARDPPGTNGSTCTVTCELSPAALQERKKMIGGLLERGLEHVEPVPGGIRARFAAVAGIEPGLRALIALEAECCAFLTMTLSAQDGPVMLEVTGPPEAQSLIAELFTVPRARRA